MATEQQRHIKCSKNAWYYYIYFIDADFADADTADDANITW